MSWALVAGLLAALAVIIGIVQNSQNVVVQYLGWTGHIPLAVLLLITVLTTVALTALAGAVWRRARRRQLTGRAELNHLRAAAEASAVEAPAAEPVPAPTPAHQ